MNKFQHVCYVQVEGYPCHATYMWCMWCTYLQLPMDNMTDSQIPVTWYYLSEQVYPLRAWINICKHVFKPAKNLVLHRTKMLLVNSFYLQCLSIQQVWCESYMLKLILAAAYLNSGTYSLTVIGVERQLQSAEPILKSQNLERT